MTIKYTKEDLVDHVGVGAVIIKDGKILLLDHVKFNVWTIPVGKALSSQTPEEGLKMEMEEELGINVTDMTKSSRYTRISMRDNIPVEVDLNIFTINAYDGDIVNKEPNKHRNLKWVELDRVRTFGKLSEDTMRYLDTINK